MRILYVSQYFPPEMGAPSARVHETAREWVRMGHQVTVLTAFAHHPTGVKAGEDRFKISRREWRDGIEVIRSYVYATPNKGVVKRMASYASFMVSAVVVGLLRAPRPEVVVATSPQLLCGLAGFILARAMGVPFVFEVRDLWPESLSAVDLMGDNFMVRQLRKVSAFLYRGAERIVTVGEGYRARIVEWYGVDKDKICVVTNGIDTRLFCPGEKQNSIREEYGWGHRFVALYIGTLGMAHALDKVLEAAEILKDNEMVLFVFVGEGAEKDGLKKTAEERGLSNTFFIDQQPKRRVPLFYSACDLGLVTLRKSDLFQEVLPSKIFEYLGMERPLLLAVGGEARKVVESAGAGEYVPPEDAEAMAGAITRLAADRVKLERMGKNGRRYVLEHYDRSVLAGSYVDMLKKVCKKENGGYAGAQ